MPGTVITNQDHVASRTKACSSVKNRLTVFDKTMRLRRIFRHRKDCFVGSDVLLSHRADSEVYDLIGSHRCDVIRPASRLLRGRVLEIGAECGAITRFVGESKLRVVALEEDTNYCRVIAMRCRDLKNVNVVRGHFDAFQASGRFQTILAIGFFDRLKLTASPWYSILARLRRIHRLLNTGGYLIIAATNRLAPSNVLAPPFYTKGKHANQLLSAGEWQSALTRAGFRIDHFLYPMPHYREARLVFGDEAFMDSELDIRGILRNNCAWEEQESIAPGTADESRDLLSSGRFDRANSFLLVCTRNDRLADPWTPKGLLRIYSTSRRKCYAKEAVVSRGPSGLHIKRTHIYENIGARSSVVHGIGRNQQWMCGTPYLNVLRDVLRDDGWQLDDLLEWARPWARYLKKRVIGPGESGSLLLPRNCVDCIPQNLIQTPDGSLHAFDLEYVSRNNPSYEYVLIRGLWHSLMGVRCGKPKTRSENGVPQLILTILRELGIKASPLLLKQAFDREIAFVNAVTGFPKKSLSKVLLTAVLRQKLARK